mmetsp:Transcript_66582/g.100329  ORF Transcript_66582/g.100329 Transcript_66582/m.100329 type:complete len:140 (+) Transcript_66582:2702-3121(+)
MDRTGCGEVLVASGDSVDGRYRGSDRVDLPRNNEGLEGGMSLSPVQVLLVHCGCHVEGDMVLCRWAFDGRRCIHHAYSAFEAKAEGKHATQLNCFYERGKASVGIFLNHGDRSDLLMEHRARSRQFFLNFYPLRLWFLP